MEVPSKQSGNGGAKSTQALHFQFQMIYLSIEICCKDYRAVDASEQQIGYT